MAMNRANISGSNFRTAFVLLLVLGVTLLFLAVAWPFLKPLLLGAMLAGLLRPLYYWITRLVGGRRSLGAALTLLVLFVLVVGPISAFVGVVVSQAVNMSDAGHPLAAGAFRRRQHSQRARLARARGSRRWALICPIRRSSWKTSAQSRNQPADTWSAEHHASAPAPRLSSSTCSS